ncbi:MAG: YafY family protein [Opitutaceae bacterium]|nr:YafY family protein [Opitutaceae bacterium]
MNRTDRLVAMVLYLQGRRVVRAEDLARHFEITVRTVYRDIAALSEGGVPVVGEAGIGYSLVKGYHLPPVMLTGDEAASLFLAAELASRVGDASMEAPAKSALLKLRSVLPRERQEDLGRLARVMCVPDRSREGNATKSAWLMPLQKAATQRRTVEIAYQGARDGAPVKRVIEPLGVTLLHSVWYLVAWCRLRSDFRSFRLDRVKTLKILPETFPERPDFNIQEFIDRLPDEETRVEVKIFFSSRVAARARIEAGRGAEIKEDHEGGIHVALKTYELEWVARWILNYGGEAAAVSPRDLVEIVEELATAVLARSKQINRPANRS